VSEATPTTRHQQRFAATGLNLAAPDDGDPRPDRFPVLINVRQIVRGKLQTRPGLNAKLTAPAGKTPWHSLRRLNDKTSSTFTYVAGIQDVIATGNAGVLTTRVTGLSGRPLSLIPFRPDQSPESWMYYFDSNKMGESQI
jgi:hypothetical protein